MTEQPSVTLVVKLRDRTAEDRLTWEETGNPNAFQTAFPTYSVTISEVSSYGSSANYILRISDAKGEVIEEITDETFGPDPRHRAAGDQLLRELFISARGSARGVDQAIRSILDALENH